MPPARRARLSSRPYSSVVAAEPCSSRGWLSVRRSRPSKRARRATTIAQGDEDGTPLTDEILVGIFAGFPDLADLLRCAATCRRWRRLVSGEAAFICHTSPRRPRNGSPFARSLALGFFYVHRVGAVPRFAPTASASRRLCLRQPCSLNALVEGLDDGLFDSSRVVASRNGLLAVELQRGNRKRAVKLCVCNPMTGEVTVLPPLGGKDIPSYYACTVLTAADDVGNDEQSRSSYRLVLVYRRRGFTACRSYSSDGGNWGPEAKVDNSSWFGNKEMAAMTAAGAGVAVGQKVFWLAKSRVFGLHLDTMQAEVVSLPQHKGHVLAGNTLLGVSPDGKLCAVQVVEPLGPATKPTIAISVHTRGWTPMEVIEVAQWLPAEAAFVKLRWVCEKSGAVFFTAGCGDQRSDVYALSLGKREVEKVASHHGGGRDDETWGNLHGYEMDQTSYLASLAMDDYDP
ncbi:hypothetical protein ACP70R_019727 [Stipagrostis hirtigluma subsp. patula]